MHFVPQDPVDSSFLRVPSPDLPTPVNPRKLEAYLHGNDSVEVAFLVEGFTYGFRIPFEGSVEFRVQLNHKSCLENLDQLHAKLQLELQSGRILGPFLEPPYANLVCSPLSLLQKQDKQSYSLIHDLSFPQGQSINSGIPKSATSVSYDTVDSVVQLVRRFGRNALLAKTDIENAFRLLPIHPSDRHLLGFTCPSASGSPLFYVDACLPMGLSTSCQTFERFSSALQWIMEHKFSAVMSHIIDDFCFVGPPSSSLCAYALDQFLVMCRDIGVPIKKEKTVKPTTCLIIYGIEIDTDKLEARLPIDKVVKIRQQLTSFARRKKVTLREL